MPTRWAMPGYVQREKVMCTGHQKTTRHSIPYPKEVTRAHITDSPRGGPNPEEEDEGSQPGNDRTPWLRLAS